MQSNIARAYDALWAEHERVRVVCMKVLAQGDRGLQRELLRAKPDDHKQHDEVLLHEERLSRPERRRILKLNTYGRKLEKLMKALLKL
jgi:hypothetical protein